MMVKNIKGSCRGLEKAKGQKRRIKLGEYGKKPRMVYVWSLTGLYHDITMIIVYIKWKGRNSFPGSTAISTDRI